MRILLVDDDAGKIGQLTGFLAAEFGIDRREEIVTAQCGSDARRLLRSECFDILILDILLPLWPEDEPSQDTSLAILRELTDRQAANRPRYILGLTAYGEAAREVGPFFAERLWTVVHVDSTSNEWLLRVGRCIEYVRTASQVQREVTYGIDLAVVTALPDPEGQAVLRLPWGWRPAEPLDDNSFLRRGAFRSRGSECSVAAVSAPRMGMVAAALVATKVIDRLRPRFLAMTGICAGIRGKVNFGDAIFVEISWDYQSGKFDRDSSGATFRPDPHQLSVKQFLLARAEQLRQETDLWGRVRSSWPEPPPEALKMAIGPVASGAAVIADGGIVATVQDQQRKVIGLEMEVYGLFAAAAAACVPRPSVFAIKSVSDFADEGKNDSYRKYAAYTSAAALQAFCESYMQDILPLAGT